MLREISLVRLEREAATAEILHSLPDRIHQVFNHHVRATPDRVALVEDGTRLTYRELDRAVGNTTGALRALGIRPGDRVMITSENSIASRLVSEPSSRPNSSSVRR